MSIASNIGIQDRLVNLDDYQVIQEICPGIGNSTIFLIEHKHDGHRLIAKVMPNERLTEEQSTQISREISILLGMQSPTIVRFYGFSLQDFNGNQNLTLLMEYKENGSLQQLIENEQNGLSSDDYDNTANQIILCGIEHGMMQHQLRPANVLLDEQFYPHIADFGLSKVSYSMTSASPSMVCCGTVPYMAPEVITDTHYIMKI